MGNIFFIRQIVSLCLIVKNFKITSHLMYTRNVIKSKIKDLMLFVYIVSSKINTVLPLCLVMKKSLIIRSREPDLRLRNVNPQESTT